MATTTAPSTHDVLITEDDGVLTVTLNRSHARNALSEAALDVLEAALADVLRRAGEVRVVVFRGAGGTFCAGGDLKAFRDGFQTESDPDTTARMNRRLGTLLTALDRLPAVVIAAVEGAAMGGGVGLATVADVTIATADARFSMTETTLGLPPAQISPFVVARVGAHQARRLMLTAAVLDATEAAGVGLVDTVVADAESLDREIARVTAAVRRCAPLANAMSKTLVHRVAEVPHEALLDEAARLFAEALLGAEARAGVQAFVDRRPAPWGQP